MKTSRRNFIIVVAGLTSSLLLDRAASADTATISESDPSAQALGYKADATKVDKAKYSNYTAGETCATCQFYQGTAGSPSGPCPLLGGKAVDAKGWCTGYAKKG
jgi:High potential iron-sulfur protein